MHDTARESAHGYALGGRVKALAGNGAETSRETSFGGLSGLRTRVGRQYGRALDHPVRPQPWSAQVVSLLQRHPLRGIGAATVAGVIAGFVVWSLINRRR